MELIEEIVFFWPSDHNRQFKSGKGFVFKNLRSQETLVFTITVNWCSKTDHKKTPQILAFNMVIIKPHNFCNNSNIIIGIINSIMYIKVINHINYGTSANYFLIAVKIVYFCSLLVWWLMIHTFKNIYATTFMPSSLSIHSTPFS